MSDIPNTMSQMVDNLTTIQIVNILFAKLGIVPDDDMEPEDLEDGEIFRMLSIHAGDEVVYEYPKT